MLDQFRSALFLICEALSTNSKALYAHYAVILEELLP